MKKFKVLFSGIFIPFIILLSFNFFTATANAKEPALFYEDKNGISIENFDVFLYTNGKIVYQVFRENSNIESLYKLNVLDEDGENLGTYTFPENHLFIPEYLNSEPVVDSNGNLLISYIVGESTTDENPFYLASISPNGKLNWEFQLDFWGPSTPIFGSDGTIYFTTSDRRSFHIWDTSQAYALTNDGKEIWMTELVGDAFAANAFINEDQNLVFFNDD